MSDGAVKRCFSWVHGVVGDVEVVSDLRGRPPQVVGAPEHGAVWGDSLANASPISDRSSAAFSSSIYQLA
jgi:hypothetical protein